MTQFSILDGNNLPKEYLYLLNKIPSNELEIFIQFINKQKLSDKEIHPYLLTIQCIKQIIDDSKDPSLFWYFILARMLFISSNYQDILDFYERLDDTNKIKVFFPFIARVLIYQNKFNEANELCDNIISSIDFSGKPEIVEVLIFYEACFTLGLSHVFTRELDKLQVTIDLLAKTSKSEEVEALISKEYFPNLSFFEKILIVLKSFSIGETAQMRENLMYMNPLIDEISDPWLIGYYHNLYTISYSQAQEFEETIQSSKLSLSNFQKVRDLRGYSTVGINLGVSYLTQGNREIGREYLENSFDPLIQLENYSLAVTHMLQVARSYLDENEVIKASKFANWAEELSQKIDITDPGTFAHFCYFYSRTRHTKKSNEYLNKLRDLIISQSKNGKGIDKDTDVYSRLWLYSAEGVNLLAKGNLELASECIATGIQLADQHNHFDFSLELSILLIEILLKQYIIFESQPILNQALAIIQDLEPLISSNEISYLKVIYNLIMAYLYRAMLRTNEGTNWYRQASEIEVIDPNSFIFSEIKRFDAINNLSNLNEGQTNLITEEQISILTVLEGLRLLRNFQFQSIEREKSVTETELPLMILVINSKNGLSLYDHKFRDTQITLNEILISGFLSAITGFSREIFGGGEITSIKQGERVILMDSLKDDNYLVLITEDESYLMRKKFRNYSKEVANLMLLDSIEFGEYVHRTDLNKVLLDKLTTQIFYD